MSRVEVLIVEIIKSFEVSMLNNLDGLVQMVYLNQTQDPLPVRHGDDGGGGGSLLSE